MPRLQNDQGLAEIAVSVRAFICIGESHPHDHPHVSLLIKEGEKHIVCPYCRTRYLYAPKSQSSDRVGPGSRI